MRWVVLILFILADLSTEPTSLVFLIRPFLTGLLVKAIYIIY